MSLFCTLALNKQVHDSVGKVESTLKPNLLKLSTKPLIFTPGPNFGVFQSNLSELFQEMKSPELFNF